MSTPEIRAAKDEVLAALQRLQTLSAAVDGDPDRVVLDWIVVYQARHFDENATGGEYGLFYQEGMQYHSMVGLLSVGMDTLDSTSGSDDDD